MNGPETAFIRISEMYRKTRTLGGHQEDGEDPEEAVPETGGDPAGDEEKEIPFNRARLWVRDVGARQPLHGGLLRNGAGWIFHGHCLSGS
jgi:hypothetical protein